MTLRFVIQISPFVNLLLGLVVTFFDREALIRDPLGTGIVDCMPKESIFCSDLIRVKLERKKFPTKVIHCKILNKKAHL